MGWLDDGIDRLGAQILYVDNARRASVWRPKKGILLLLHQPCLTFSLNLILHLVVEDLKSNTRDFIEELFDLSTVKFLLFYEDNNTIGNEGVKELKKGIWKELRTL